MPLAFANGLDERCCGFRSGRRLSKLLNKIPAAKSESMASGSPRGRGSVSLFKVVLLVAFATLLVMGTEAADARRVSVESASLADEAFPVQKKADIYVWRSSRKLAQKPPSGRRRLQGSPAGRRLQAPPTGRRLQGSPAGR